MMQLFEWAGNISPQVVLRTTHSTQKDDPESKPPMGLNEDLLPTLHCLQKLIVSNKLLLLLLLRYINKSSGESRICRMLLPQLLLVRSRAASDSCHRQEIVPILCKRKY